MFAALVTISPDLLAIISGLVIPVLVGLGVKLDSGDGKRKLLTGLLAVTVGLLTQLVAAPEFEVKDLALQALLAYGAALASFYTVWKPTGVTDRVQDNTSSIGI